MASSKNVSKPSFSNKGFTQIRKTDDLKGTGKSDPLYSVTSAERARVLTFILFSEIIEDSPVQGRANVFDPNKSSADKELLESIKANGVVQPIVVRSLEDSDAGLGLGAKKGERKFAIVAGHRRVAAGRAAGLNGTEGMIARTGDDHELITLAENMGRKELSAYERALALKSLQERRDLSVRKVADAAGVSAAYTSDLFNALTSPEPLKGPWKEGAISTDVVVGLKNHWEAFDQIKDKSLIGKISNITISGSKALRDQLDAGTNLADALTAMSTTAFRAEQGSGGNRGPYKKSTKDNVIKNSKAYKEAFSSAVQDVFAKIDQDKAEVLFQDAVRLSVNDADTLWAAALYVAKGGNQDKAVELASAVMQIPGVKSAINKEVRAMRKVAANLDKFKKKDKNATQFLKMIFSGI